MRRVAVSATTEVLMNDSNRIAIALVIRSVVV
jgi:hypothetical protein